MTPRLTRCLALCALALAVCIGIGAALCGRLPVREGDKVCFIISGGSVALEQLHQLEDVRL